MRTRLIVTAGTAALALAGSVLGAAPAMAALSDPTTVTFTLASDSVLQIEVAAASSALTAAGTIGTTGTTVSGALPLTTITDGRSQLAGGWAVTIVASAFTNTTTPAAPAILASAASATTDLALLATGNTARTTGGTAAVAYTPAGSLAAASPLVAATLVQGYAVTTYTPSISIAVPPTAVVGAYTGTVTQTLS